MKFSVWPVSKQEASTAWQGQERCGVWFEDEAVYEIQNASQTPEVGFKMAAADLHWLSEELDLPIAGVWHSHPDGKPLPSITDLDFHPVGHRMAVVEGGVWREFSPESGRLL